MYARYDEVLRQEKMNKELTEAKGEYAWARVHAARQNIADCKVMSSWVERC